MTLTKLSQVIASIRNTVLVSPYSGAPVRRMDTTKILSRMTPVELMGHVLYMCEEMDKFLAEGRIEKCMRWLGFAQAVLFMMDLATVQDLENMNKP